MAKFYQADGMSSISEQALISLAEQLGDIMQQQSLMLVTAESCTGGWVAQTVTAVSGSSSWFDRGFVTYSNASKQQMLGVSEDTLAQYGAVSNEVVREMARGALTHSQGNISLAISGIAGPGGGTLEKPVGTVCLAWAVRGKQVNAERFLFAGDRRAVRAQAVMQALQGVLSILEQK